MACLLLINVLRCKRRGKGKMFTGFYVSAAGMLAQMNNLNVISNNLANINSSGFKKDKSIFRTFYDDSINSTATPLTSSGTTLMNKDLNSMAIIEKTITNYNDGIIKQTGNTLDLAIQGDGFFELRGPRGETYFSRSGSFQLNGEGELVNPEGFKLMGEIDVMRIEEGAEEGVAFDETGLLKVGEREIDNVSIVTFIDNSKLEKIGNTLFVNNSNKNLSDELFSGKIYQGHLEMSNVNPIEEMTKMISTTRAFTAYQKVLQAIMDDTTEKTINLVGRKG
jgi:flagellar basal-body rod protein FlgG